MTLNDIDRRQHRLNKLLTDHHLDALALNPGPNLMHLTGLNFHLMERPLVALFPTDGEVIFVLPELEQAKLDELTFDIQAFTYPEDRAAWPKAFRQALEAGNLDEKKIGVISRRLRVLELRFLENAAPHAKFISAEKVATELRMRKDIQEIDHMRQAAHCAQIALKAALTQLKIGMTEREFAAELVTQLLQYGSDPHLPFFPIVASGPHSANPHATPTDRKLAEGDILLIDWGANIEGYFSDITRTFAIGEIDPKLMEIGQLVAQANSAGRRTAKDGIPAKDVDLAARQVISQAGYGDSFIHRTGHGLGREAHEEPYISAENEQPLEEGMTFTIEPGIYLPRVGGLRIEDDVVITENGCESLTDLPRDLIQVGDQ